MTRIDTRSDMTTLSPIPQPATIPFLGNVHLIDLEVPLRSFFRLAKQYGEIYQLSFSGRPSVVHVNSAAMVRQLSDDALFKKSVSRGLMEVRNLVGDGLFTAHTDERNWGIAHRILMPAFGAASIRQMFPDMQDVCSQLLLKWRRFGPSYVFDASDEFTRVTFDTIALCSMSYRFNSFYERDIPVFTQEMSEFLSMCSRRIYRPSFTTKIPLYHKKEDERYFDYVKHMTEVAKDIIKRRKEQPSEKRDLLTLMMEGKDPRTGDQLSEQSILYNLLTFLIAGHETTSGLLTFATYYLLKNPPCLQKLRDELDEVLGSDEPTVEDLGKMPYLTAILRETLRLCPTVPARSVVPKQDTELIGGDGDASNPLNHRYGIKAGQLVVVHATTAHRDPLVWGYDAEDFRPERMLGGKFEALPRDAWQPFSHGARGCIGRAFAWQEAMLVMASVFNQFDMYLKDPSYTLEFKQTLTIKPMNMLVEVSPRPGKWRNAKASRSILRNPSPSQELAGERNDEQDGHPLLVLYGSNTGTCLVFAQRLASKANVHGFNAQIETLDGVAGRLPVDISVVIIASSFEGKPAENAGQFVSWVSNLRADSLSSVTYAIFGCGSTEWVRTYQRIPRLIDEKLAGAGAKRLLERGEADTTAPDFSQRFDEFEEKLWKVLEEKYHTGSSRNSDHDGKKFVVELHDPDESRKKALRYLGFVSGKISQNRVLTKPGVAEKRYIEIELPNGVSYRAGDYLAVLPTNPNETVERVLTHFGLSGDQEVVIRAHGSTSFPTDTPISARTLLRGFVELSQPASTRDLQTIKSMSSGERTVAELTSLIKQYRDKVLLKRLSVLDILEQYEVIQLPFATYLALLPPMRVRQYSISSSPLASHSHASLTFSVFDVPALCAPQSRRFRGVASTFLAGLKPGDHVSLSPRPSTKFTLPPDPTTPIVMFAAGSGIAPFRGFIQERALQKASGLSVGHAVLFFGCRDPEQDFIFMDSELQVWARMGVVDVKPAFSMQSEASEGCKYVQHRAWVDRQIITALNDEFAQLYVCGSRRVANGIKQVLFDIIGEMHPDWNKEQQMDAWERVWEKRYHVDCFD